LPRVAGGPSGAAAERCVITRQGLIAMAGEIYAQAKEAGQTAAAVAALYVATDPLVVANRIRINTFALSARLPMMTTERTQIEAAGLLSYGPDIPDQFRRAADMGRQDLARGKTRRHSRSSSRPSSTLSSTSSPPGRLG
jgi:hypothetical protein